MEYKNLINFIQLICYLVLKQDQNYLPKLKKKIKKNIRPKGLEREN